MSVELSGQNAKIQHGLARCGIAAIVSVSCVVGLACSGTKQVAPVASGPTTPTTTSTQVVSGISVTMPVGWSGQPTADRTGSVIGNARELSPMEAGATDEAAFRVKVMANANPGRLPVAQWFDEHYANGFDGPVQTRSDITVDGRSALSIIVAASGEWRIVFIGKGADIVRLSYQTTFKNFASEYEALLGSVKIAQ